MTADCTRLLESAVKIPQKSSRHKKYKASREIIRLDIRAYLGAKYLGFFSSRSLKMREKYISFAQFVYFLGKCVYFSIFE